LKRIFIVACIVLTVCIRAAEEPRPELGERILTAAETEAALSAMSVVFKQHETVRATIRSEIEDLAGKRVEDGILLMDRGVTRPVRVLRTFSKPKSKAWLLNGTTISDVSASQKKVFVKDLNAAPNMIKTIQAAMTGDVKALDALFSIRVFSKSVAGSNVLRLVLDKKPGLSKYVHRQIIARIAEGGLFFSEIRYIPDEGDELTETFSDVVDAGKLSDADFALTGTDGFERKVETISE